MKYVHVPREMDDESGNKAKNDLRSGVPHEEVVFPQARSKNGMSNKKVAQATRDFFNREYPSRGVERVELLMHEKGWSLIWSPRYMPSFQPTN